MQQQPQQQVPVTVIGGFLGSGKTTLLNHVLTRTTGVRYAVMVNDFGDLAIDEALIKQHDGDTISFANGCVCCSLGDNLMQSIDQLLTRNPAPEHFLVEVSGVANPKAIADVATLHPHLRRDLIITMADAESLMQRMQNTRLSDTVAMQLAPADLIVLNKCDLVSEATLGKVSKHLQDYYKAGLLRTTHAAIPPEVLSQHEVTLEANPELDPDPEYRNPGTEKSWRHNPEKDFYRSTVTPPEAMTPLELAGILNEHLPVLLRAKGFIRATPGGDSWCSIQLSGKQLEVQPLDTTFTPDTAVLVLIGLQPLHEISRKITG